MGFHHPSWTTSCHPERSLALGGRSRRISYNRVMREYYVYIMASKSGVLYIGVTNDLTRRIYEHKKGLIPGFSQKYKTKRLVYFDSCSSITDAIDREKQLKGWIRQKKDNLINTINPTWSDLSRSFDSTPPSANWRRLSSAQNDK